MRLRCRRHAAGDPVDRAPGRGCRTAARGGGVRGGTTVEAAQACVRPATAWVDRALGANALAGERSSGANEQRVQRRSIRRLAQPLHERRVAQRPRQRGQRRQMLVAAVRRAQQQDHQVDRLSSIAAKSIGRASRTNRAKGRATASSRACGRAKPLPSPVEPRFSRACSASKIARRRVRGARRPARQLLQHLRLVGDAQTDNDLIRADDIADRHQSGALRR